MVRSIRSSGSVIGRDATPEKALAEAKTSQRNPTVVKEVKKWLVAARGEDGFNGDNLAAVRERIITQILSLR